MAPATSPSTDAWLARLDTTVRLVRVRWPEHDAELDDILALARQVAHARPRAQAVTSAGDGLRSPSTEGGSRSIGGHSDPTAMTALAATEGFFAEQIERGLAAGRLGITCLRVMLTHNDPERARKNLSGAREELLTALSTFHGVLPRTTTVHRLAETERGDKGCASCRRVAKSNGKGKLWRELYRGVLCRWCYREATANRNAWTERHPDRTPVEVSDPRWWPNARLVEWTRDHGEKHLSPAERARLESKGKRKRRAS